MNDSSIAAQFLIRETQKRCGKIWVGSKIQSPAPVAEQLDPVTFFRYYTLRQISFRVNKAILGWAAGSYPLQLVYHKPTPTEMLQLQAKGHRFVSILNDNSDALKFLIHDLEHAERFFSDPKLLNLQTRYFGFMEKIVEAGLLNEFFIYPSFMRKFEYLISDMNSHPNHLFGYLKHLIIEGLLSHESLPACARLSKTSKVRFEEILAAMAAV